MPDGGVYQYIEKDANHLVNLDLSVIELVIIWGGITYMGRTYTAYVFQI